LARHGDYVPIIAAMACLDRGVQRSANMRGAGANFSLAQTGSR
jgi:hypothetical protein